MVKSAVRTIRLTAEVLLDDRMSINALSSDEDLARAVQSGEVGAYELLILRYEERIHRYIMRLLPEIEEAQDLLQETFMKVYVNINSFDTKRKFSSWIYRIAHNEVINKIRQKNRENFVSFDLDTFLPYSVIEEDLNKNHDFKLTSAELDHYLEKLGVKYREPLILFYIEGLSYNDISDILRLPVSTVGVRIKRGKNMLKNICKEAGLEP